MTSGDFNSNLKPLDNASGTENLEGISPRAKKNIVSEDQAKLLPLDRVELSREISPAPSGDMGMLALREEHLHYLDTMRKSPEFKLEELQQLKNLPQTSKSINKRA
jgi:hypothetical protein